MSQIMANIVSSPSNCPKDHLSFDDEDWMPAKLKHVLNLEDIPIVVFEDSIKQQVIKNCINSRQVGITCISSKMNFLVCLTTENRIFVLKMKYNSHVEFFKKLLNKDDLKFFIYRGPNAANHLQRRFGVTLGANVIDLNTLDVFISMREHSLGGSAPKNHYSTKYFFDNRDRLTKNIDLNGLAESWTGVILKIEYSKKVLDKEPYDIAAKNYIKQRSALTRVIGNEMLSSWERMKFQEVDNIYSFAPRASREAFNHYDCLEDKSYNNFNCILRTLDEAKTDDNMSFDMFSENNTQYYKNALESRDDYNSTI